MLFLPAYTPEFSAIESLFGRIKVELRDKRYKKKEQLAKLIVDIGFKMPSWRIEGFFRRTINDMKEFYESQDWSLIFAEDDDNPNQE